VSWRQLGELMFPDRRVEVEFDNRPVALERADPHRRPDGFLEPLVQVVGDRNPIGRDVDAAMAPAEVRVHLADDFVLCLPVEILALSLSAAIAQIDRGSPNAVIALVDRPGPLRATARLIWLPRRDDTRSLTSPNACENTRSPMVEHRIVRMCR
jgi:CTP:molybdopterin cytidylyltransferase MocA